VSNLEDLRASEKDEWHCTSSAEGSSAKESQIIHHRAKEQKRSGQRKDDR